MRDLTLKQIKEEKSKLEKLIRESINDFNKTTNVVVDRINFNYSDFGTDAGYSFSILTTIDINVDYEKHLKNDKN